MDNAGRLCVTAHRDVEGKRNIPIDFKPANATATTGEQPKTKWMPLRLIWKGGGEIFETISHFWIYFNLLYSPSILII